MSKSISIKDLLAKKEQLKKKKQSTEMLFIESLDGYITIKEPTRDFCLESLEMAQSVDSDKADIHIVYNSVTEPNLKDKDIQKEFGCVAPTDIVEMLFKPGEISAISGHCLQLAGYGNGMKKLDKTIKN